MAQLRPLVGRYFRVMLATIVVVVVLGLAMLWSLGRPPPLWVSIVPTAVAAFDGGRHYVLEAGKGPGFSNGLRLTALYFLISLITYAVIAIGALVSSGSLIFLSSATALLGPFIAFSALWFITIRVMMWFGSRMGF